MTDETQRIDLSKNMEHFFPLHHHNNNNMNFILGEESESQHNNNNIIPTLVIPKPFEEEPTKNENNNNNKNENNLEYTPKLIKTPIQGENNNNNNKQLQNRKRSRNKKMSSPRKEMPLSQNSNNNNIHSMNLDRMTKSVSESPPPLLMGVSPEQHNNQNSQNNNNNNHYHHPLSMVPQTLQIGDLSLMPSLKSSSSPETTLFQNNNNNNNNNFNNNNSPGETQDDGFVKEEPVDEENKEYIEQTPYLQPPPAFHQNNNHNEKDSSSSLLFRKNEKVEARWGATWYLATVSEDVPEGKENNNNKKTPKNKKSTTRKKNVLFIPIIWDHDNTASLVKLKDVRKINEENNNNKRKKEENNHHHTFIESIHRKYEHVPNILHNNQNNNLIFYLSPETLKEVESIIVHHNNYNTREEEEEEELLQSNHQQQHQNTQTEKKSFSMFWESLQKQKNVGFCYALADVVEKVNALRNKKNAHSVIFLTKEDDNKEERTIAACLGVSPLSYDYLIYAYLHQQNNNNNNLKPFLPFEKRLLEHQTVLFLQKNNVEKSNSKSTNSKKIEGETNFALMIEAAGGVVVYDDNNDNVKLDYVFAPSGKRIQLDHKTRGPNKLEELPLLEEHGLLMEIHRYYETQKQQQNSENHHHHHKLQTQEEEEEIIAVKGVSPKKRPAPTQRLLNPPTTSTTTSPLKGKENTEEDVVNENEYTVVPFTPTEGEDYYFRVPLPRQDAPVADPVALGRVVKVHYHYNNNNNTQEVMSVTMQLYEVNSVFMQANPFSPNQIEQRTVVRLSGEQTTVAVTSLWAEVPVYVITPSLQRHVYFLEESE